MSRVSWLEIEHHAMPLKNVMQVQSANPNRNRRPTRKRQISTAPTHAKWLESAYWISACLSKTKPKGSRSGPDSQEADNQTAMVGGV